MTGQLKIKERNKMTAAQRTNKRSDEIFARQRNDFKQAFVDSEIDHLQTLKNSWDFLAIQRSIARIKRLIEDEDFAYELHNYKLKGGK